MCQRRRDQRVVLTGGGAMDDTILGAALGMYEFIDCPRRTAGLHTAAGWPVCTANRDTWVSSAAWSILACIAASALVVATIGCALPANWRLRISPAKRTGNTRCQLRPVVWPTVWSCAAPRRPLTILEAHRAVQEHREHSCARKRAAFETLIAAGRPLLDSPRSIWIRGAQW